MIWSFQIKLNAVDITAEILNQPAITATESGSGLASFTFRPAVAGDFRGQSVEVLISVGVGALTPVHLGKVTRSTYDIATGNYEIQSSDEIQEHFRQLTDQEVLDFITDSVYSDAVFGNSEDRWKYTQDCLSTVPAEVHFDAAGVMQLVDWAAKATPDFVLTGDNIHSIPSNAYVERAADDQVNSVEISYGYGFTRWLSRLHSYAYSFSFGNPAGHTTWCEWYTAAGQDSFELPLVDPIRSAVLGTGWALLREDYDGNPYFASCDNGVIVYDLTEEHSLETMIVTVASLDLYKNFAQPIGEDYTLTVQSSASIARYGTVTRTRAAGRDTPVDGDSFTDAAGYQSGWAADSNGDRFENQDDVPTLNNDIQCSLQSAMTTIWERHRNTLTFVADINPAITLASTIELSGVVLQSGTLNAKGKVQSLAFNLNRNTPSMQITLAITRGAGGTGDTLAPPARPDTSPQHSAPATNTILNNHVGNRLDSPDYPPNGDTWTGWIINSRGIFTPPDVPTEDQIYPGGEFRVGTVGVEDEAVNELAATTAATYNVAIPDDPFSIT